jgi:hypothetical protein
LAATPPTAMIATRPIAHRLALATDSRATIGPGRENGSRTVIEGRSSDSGGEASVTAGGNPQAYAAAAAVEFAAERTNAGAFVDESSA